MVNSSTTGSCWRGWLAVCPAVMMAAAACSTGSDGGGAAADGALLYERYCVACHGVAGDGNGPAAYLLFPKPRNFQRGEFKLRSTRQGSPPTDADLVRTVTEGIPGTSMFAFGDLLSGDQVGALVAHVKSLSPALAGASPASEDQLLSIAAPPEPSAQLVAIGRQTYADFRCAQCHGPEGRGDGPSAPELRDSEGNPFPAADFTYGIYKSGGNPEGLYRVFLTGMAGTPMPSYESAFTSDDQAWGLVYYLFSLADERPPTRSDRGPLVAAVFATPDPLADPWASAWDRLEPHRVVLRPLWFRNDFTPTAQIRAGIHGDRLALMVEWRDASHDAAALATEGFSDGAALQLGLADPPPFVGMGAAGRGNQVEVWYWRAERQAVYDGTGLADVPDAHPDMFVDGYPFAGPRPDDPTSAVGDVAAEPTAPFAPGRDVGNPVSDPALMNRPVHSLASTGFGSLTSRSADAMRAAGIGSWRDGTYRVVFAAPRQPADPQLEADLREGPVPLAVAIWDGGAGDRNGTKLVSQWLRLTIPAAAAASAPAGGSDDPVAQARAATRRDER